MINIAINGCNGKMGQVVAETIAASFSDSARVSYGVDLSAPQNTPFPVYTAFPQIPEAVRADVMIDFSNPAALPGLLNFARSRRIPVVIATTGLSKEDEQLLRAASAEIPVFWSANMSLGICLIKELAKKAAAFLGENFDIEIVGCPIVREEDGLAKSSRNTYLSKDERKAALILSKAVKLGEDMAKAGEKDTDKIVSEMIKLIETEPMAKIDYVQAVDAVSVKPVKEMTAPVLVAMAVYIGKTRLIDNFIYEG